MSRRQSRAKMLATLLATMLLASATANDVELDIHSVNGANWSIAVGGVVWLRSSGHLRFFCEGLWRVSGQSMREISREKWNSTDEIGPFNATSIHWQATSTCVLDTTFKIYDGSTVAFEQSYPTGANHTNFDRRCASDLTHCSTRTSNVAPIAGFPAFDISSAPSQRLGWVAFHDTQIRVSGGHGTHTMTNKRDVFGLNGGPVLMFDSHRAAAVLSPLASRSVRLSTSFIQDCLPSHLHLHNCSWSHGISSELRSLPPGFTHTTILHASATRGVTDTVHSWGSIILKATGMGGSSASRMRVFDDPSLRTLSMWTDNGAFLHVNSWANDNESLACKGSKACVEGALVDAKVSLDKQQVPVQLLQLDSWYYDGRPASGHVYCVGNWSQAKDLLFPSGSIVPAIKQLNVSTILYTPFFCNDSVYWQSYRHIEGSPDQSIINTTETPTNVLPDDAEAFYSDLMEWGTQQARMRVFEVDFLSQNFMKFAHHRIDESQGKDEYARWLIDGHHHHHHHHHHHQHDHISHPFGTVSLTCSAGLSDQMCIAT